MCVLKFVDCKLNSEQVPPVPFVLVGALVVLIGIKLIPRPVFLNRNAGPLVGLQLHVSEPLLILLNKL